MAEVLYDAKRSRARGVRVIDANTMQEREYTARLVFLCASAIESVRLLLNSKSARFPDGLANSSGTLGRYVMDHHYGSGASGTVPGFTDKRTIGRRPNGIYIARFRNVKTQHPDFLRGYGMQGGSGRSGWGRGANMVGYGASFKQSLIDDLGPWGLSASGWGETLPHEDNRVTLDPEVKDKWGIPAARIDVRWRDNERAMDKDMKKAMAEMLDAAGCTNVRQHGSNNPPGHCIHEMGGARMSKTPKRRRGEPVESGVGREESLSHRRRVHGQLGVPESEHHLHGDHGARRLTRGGRDETRRGVMADMTRRQALGTMSALAAATTLAPREMLAGTARSVGGRFKQSVSRWCYGKIPIDDLCDAAKTIGYKSIELLDEKDWPVPFRHGLVCAMANGFGTIPVGFNRPDQHDKLVADGTRMIPLAAAAGVPNIVCFSGNRAGMSDGEGIANCIAGFKRLTPTGGEARRHAVPRAAEQQGGSQGLSVRSHRVGRAGGARRQLAAVEAAV